MPKKYDVAYIHHHDQKIYFSVKKCCLNSILKSIFWPWYMLLWTPDVFSKKIKIFFDFEGPKIDVAAAINLALAKLLLNRRHSISKENWSNLITSRLLCTALKIIFSSQNSTTNHLFFLEVQTIKISTHCIFKGDDYFWKMKLQPLFFATSRDGWVFRNEDWGVIKNQALDWIKLSKNQ